MAFSGTPSTTGGTILGSTVTDFYEKTMLEWMRPTFRFYTFATKKPIPQREGDAIVFNRKVALGNPYVLSQGVPISAVKTVSTNQVSALLQQIGDSVGISDYARLTSSIDTDAYALEVMADQAANAVDQYILEEIASNTVINHYVKKAGTTTQGGRGSVVSAASATRLALSDVRTVATNLRAKNVKPYDQGGFIGIFHSYQIGDLMGDSNFRSWVSYDSPDKMYDFEIGKAMGVRIMESNKVPIAPGSAYSGDSVSTATGSAIVAYGGVIFGEDAYAITEIDGGIQTFKSTGASKQDPNNLVDVYAWKATLAAKVLNPSAIEVVWSTQDEVSRPSAGGTGVVSAIAATDFTVLYPSTTGDYYDTLLTSW
jgi:N4-gp56 family major capsid protein